MLSRMIADRFSSTNDVHQNNAHCVKVDVCDLGVGYKADG